jgi:Trypsin-like peptidase domain
MRKQRALSSKSQQRVRAATVSLPDKGGQGVLVPGGFVLTAAHCVEWSGDGAMVLGDPYVASVEPKVGASFKLSVYAVDPVADIAVLGGPDNQIFSDYADAFESFCEATAPVHIRADNIRVNAPVSANVLSHKDTWIKATATRHGTSFTLLGPSLFIEARSSIEAGTSGGPVVDDAGRLIGIVSTAGGTSDETREGTMPRPHLALPAWVWRRVDAAQRRSAT